MAEREDFSALRLVVVFLRTYSRKTQAEFGRDSQVDQADVSRFEIGKQVPPEETLRRMAKAAGVPWSVVVHLRRFYESVLSAVDRGREAAPEADCPFLERFFMEPALLAMTPHFLESRAGKPEPTPESQRRDAEEIWKALELYPMPQRRKLIELSAPSARNWALTALACDASLQAAEQGEDEALELADLALSITGKLRGDEGWRSRVEGYAWAHVAHARRAAGDLPGAAEAFARARDLWRAGEGSAAPDRLPESRLRDLEAWPGSR